MARKIQVTRNYAPDEQRMIRALEALLRASPAEEKSETLPKPSKAEQGLYDEHHSEGNDAK